MAKNAYFEFHEILTIACHKTGSPRFKFGAQVKGRSSLYPNYKLNPDTLNTNIGFLGFFGISSNFQININGIFVVAFQCFVAKFYGDMHL